MSVTSIDEEQLKTLLKTALVEIIEEKKDFFRGLLEEMLEEIALVRAIEEGRQTENISREEVFRVFEDKI